MEKYMKLIIVAIALFLVGFSIPSFATGNGNHGNNNGPRNGGNSTSNAAAISGAASSSRSESRATSRSKSKSEAEATGGNAKGGSATSSSGGNTITVTGAGTQGTTHFSGYEIKNTPDVFAPTALTTSPCRNGVSGGVAGPAFGVTFGGSGKDVACDLRQLAILYNGLGEKAKAVQVADGALALECGDEATAKALGGLCQEKKPEENSKNPAFNSN
jgi:hypothetical protein